MLMTLTTKRCPRCKEEKEVSAFGKSKARKDGLQVYCKQCHVEASKESQARRAAKGPDPIPHGSMKRCHRCEEDKPQTSAFFSERKKSKDGLQVYCKQCMSEAARDTNDRRAAKGPDPIPPGSVKMCSRCGETKPQTSAFFSKDKTRKDGLTSKCKPCNVNDTMSYYESSENGYTPSSCLYIAELPWELDHRDLLKVGISSLSQPRPWDYGDSLPEIFNWPDTPDGQEACAAAEREIKKLRATEAAQGDWDTCGPIRTPAGRTEVYLPTHRARIREIAIEHGGQAMGRITYSLRNQSRR